MSQPNSTPVGSDKIISWTPPVPLKKALSDNMSLCILTQLDEIWKTISTFLKIEEDIHFCLDEIWRPPHIFFNGKLPQFSFKWKMTTNLSRQPAELIFSIKNK